MQPLTTQEMPQELLRQLEASAAKNHRTLAGEILARLEMSFAVEAAARTKNHQTWMDEALLGDFRPGSAARLRHLAASARAGAR